MKKLVMGLIVLVALEANAQVFPFSEGFTGIPNNSLPTGWSGDMKVLAYHGINDDKALTSDMSSVDITDTAQTPWIGPLPSNTEIFFFYRIVDEFIYPSTEKHYTGSDYFKVQLTTDEQNYSDLFTVDSSNQFATLNFRKQSLYLTSYGGQNIKIRFLTQYNAGSSYFVDIDSVRVRVGTNPTGIDEPLEDLFTIFPNPVYGSCTVHSKDLNVDSPVKFVLLSQDGKVLNQGLLPTENFVLETENFTPGVYFLQLYNSDTTLTRKLIFARQ